MVGVFRESQDTRIGGGELRLPRDDLGMVGVSRESQDTQKGGRWTVSIPG